MLSSYVATVFTRVIDCDSMLEGASVNAVLDSYGVDLDSIRKLMADNKFHLKDAP